MSPSTAFSSAFCTGIALEKIGKVIMVMEILAGHRGWCPVLALGSPFYRQARGVWFYAVPLVARKECLRKSSENNNTDKKILSMTSAEW